MQLSVRQLADIRTKQTVNMFKCGQRGGCMVFLSVKSRSATNDYFLMIILPITFCVIRLV